MTPLLPPALALPGRRAAALLVRTRPDSELARLAAAGHDLAFEALARRHQRALLRHAARVVGPDRAEDAVQQGLLNAVRALRDSGAPENPEAWLHRLVRNAAIDHLRRAPGAQVQLDERLATADGPEEVVLRRERTREALAGVAALPDGQRNALLMREIQGASHAEIATALEVSAPAARQLIHRARTRLREVAALLLPPGLVERLTPAGSDRAVESASGLLAGGVLAKTAAVLVTGTVVVGGIAGPMSTPAQRVVPGDPAQASSQHAGGSHSRSGAAAAVGAASLATDASSTAGTEADRRSPRAGDDGSGDVRRGAGLSEGGGPTGDDRAGHSDPGSSDDDPASPSGDDSPSSHSSSGDSSTSDSSSGETSSGDSSASGDDSSAVETGPDPDAEPDHSSARTEPTSGSDPTTDPDTLDPPVATRSGDGLADDAIPGVDD